MTDLAKLVIAVDSSQTVQAQRDVDRLANSADKAEAYISKMGRTMAGIATAVGLVAAVKQLYDTNAEFQRLDTSLVTVTHSQERANQVFGDLQQFAATTPYQLREVTQAYILMRARGLDPSLDTMRSLGNLASAMSRPLIDTVQAVGSLAAGEIEPIKQLGFQAMVIGDKVRVASDGVSKLVDRNAYAISKAVADISDAKFAGGMERQINTLGGAWSNLQDQIDITLYKMGQGGFNTKLVSSFQQITSAIDQATPSLTKYTTTAVNGTMAATKFIYEHRDAVIILAGAYASVKVGQTIAKWADATGDWIQKAKEAHQATLVWNSSTMMHERVSANANLATKGWNAAIGALGGTLSASIALIGTIAVIAPMAWEASKSSAQKASEEADKYLVRLREEVSLLDRKKELQKSGRSTESSMDDETIKALQAKEKYAGELQVKLASAQKRVESLSAYAGLEPGQDHGYQAAVASEVAAQNDLNKAMAEYNEIATSANRIKDENARKTRESKIATDAEAKAAAEKARRDLEATKQAQELAKLVEEKKDFLKGLSKSNAVGSREIASGLVGTEEDHTAQEILKLQEEAKRLRLAGNDLLAVQERIRQIKEKASIEREADLRKKSRRQAEEEQHSVDAYNMQVSRREFDLFWQSYKATASLRVQEQELNEERIRTNSLLQIGAVSQDEYRKRITAIRVEQLRLKAESGDVWAIIGYQITQAGGKATDALVSWMDNLDGVGRSWRTLGDTVEAVLRDMIIQMQRAVIQQQIMDPLFQWAGLGLSTWLGSSGSGGSGSSSGGASGPVPMGSYASSVSNLSSGASASRMTGSAPVQSQVIVNVHPGASQGSATPSTSNSGSAGKGVSLARDIESAVVSIIQKHQRPGGVLNPA